ncbi:MAG: GIY-YIG nuclease family protein [bacterium]
MTIYKKNEINKLKPSLGVYLFKRKNKILYVGKSINIKARIKSHIESAKKDKKENKIIEKYDTIEIINTDFEFNALLLESKLINKYKPQYNSRWKDDKSYIYINISNDSNYPKIFITRKNFKTKRAYYGPFPSVQNTEYILKQIRRIFPYCTQQKLSKKACFYNKIKLCNPCPNLIETEKNIKIKHKLIKEYKRNLNFVKKILEGKNKAIEKDLLNKIKTFSQKENYDQAINYRNKLLLFQKLIYMHLYNSDSENKIFKSPLKNLKLFLSKYFNIKKLKRIECYDLSNISFKYSTGSMVVAEDGQLNKDEYRKFKIRKEKNNADLFMLEEVLKRRFKNNWPTPDLLLVDGGKPQVNTTIKILKKLKLNIPIIGIAKNPDRLVIGIKGFPTLKPNLTEQKFKLLILLRDESHRFAKKYHLYLRNLKLNKLKS